MNTAKEVLVEAGLDKSHWGIRVIDAENIGFFTVTDKEDVTDWFSYPCGMLNENIGRAWDDEPLDDELMDCSGKFFRAVKGSPDCIEAALALVKIVKRSNMLSRGEV